MEDDWILYERFQQGEVSSFNRLFERYKNRLLNLAYRFVRNRQAAEDIAQEVLIKVYEKKVRFDPKAKFSTWVFRVTANASVDWIRKRRFTGDTQKEEAPAPSPSSTPGDRELHGLLERAIEELPEKLRLPIRLFQFEDKSYGEIALILQISVKAVERRLYHAKQILKGKLTGLID